MRLVAPILASLVVLAACGNNLTPAEQAYLKQLQQQGSQVQLSDPSGKLAAGRTICAGLSNFKPGFDRDFAVYQYKQDPRLGYLTTTAALDQLCPELKG